MKVNYFSIWQRLKVKTEILKNDVIHIGIPEVKYLGVNLAKYI